MSDESAIDWNLYVICQKTSSEDWRCPLRNCSDVYSAFLSNVEEFRELDCLPINVNFGNQGTVESFTHNKASWHKQCHQKFYSSMLHCMQLKRKSEFAEMEGTGCTRDQSVFLCLYIELFASFVKVMRRQSLFMSLPLTRTNL